MIGQTDGMGSIEELAQKMKALAGNMQQPDMGGNAMSVGGPQGRGAFRPGPGGPFSGGGIGAPGTVNPDTGTPRQWEPPPPANSTPMMGSRGQVGERPPADGGEMKDVDIGGRVVRMTAQELSDLNKKDTPEQFAVMKKFGMRY